ncbi:MAG: hypothetical protein HYS18_01675 [Burkholderiales bacterium]|nr:hypothetical protein [Burkholderiales bacterium]
MFRSNLATYPYISHGPSYGQNLARATKGFLAALLAQDLDEFESTHPADVDRVEGIEEINALATHFDELMPSQAAELRYLAGSEPLSDDQEF